MNAQYLTFSWYSDFIFWFILYLWSKISCVIPNQNPEFGKVLCEVLPFHHRRIAYQEATQTFGVITRRIELQDPATGKTYPSHPSASLTASTITYSSAKTGDANMASSSKACDRALMGEVELCSLLIVDQHTFEGEISFASKEGRPQRESDLSLLIFVYALSLKNSPWVILL